MVQIYKSVLLILFVTLASHHISIAQSGLVEGRVKHATTLENLSGITVEIPGTEIKTVTDKNGVFVIKQIPAGTVVLRATGVSFDPTEQEVTIVSDETITVELFLNIKITSIENVTVTATRKTNTQSAVVRETKDALSVISGISRQQIVLSQDNNAAQVIQRIPGVTVVENRFVMIRGLSERYNNVLINNIVAPATEVDKRTFSFDLIPSGALDRMLIFKSGSADNPGDFAGGVIKIFTNNAVEKPFTEITVGTGFRTNTTFKDYYQSKGSGTDLLGFDNGYRALPSAFPSTDEMLNSGRLSELRKTAALKLKNNFVPEKHTALPDLSLGLSLGRKWLVGKHVLNTVTSISISQSYQFTSRDFFRYFEYDATRPDALDKRFAYLDAVYEKTNRVNVLTNWQLTLKNGDKISFSNLFNQIGENETNLRSGEDYIQTLGWRKHYMLGYRSRSIYTGQFNGTHQLKGTKSLNWMAGYSFLKESEPDLRRFRTYAPTGSGATADQYIMITPPSSNLFDASRYYGKLNEHSVDGGVNYTYKFYRNNSDKEGQIKAGVYGSYRKRTFSSRYISYLVPGSITPDRKAELESLPLSVIFSPETLAEDNTFVIEEGTRSQDAYDASNLLGAGFVSVVYPVKKLTIQGGIRSEYIVQQLNSFQGLVAVNVDNDVLSLLPFVNFTLHSNEKSQWRLGYGRTVNRPEFRELAPFLFYDYKLDANRSGNPSLKTAVIDNVDLRYEFYPRAGETVSLGVFYKYFNNPIENKNIITSELPQFTYINADFAENYGVELELRKSFDNAFTSSFLRRFSVNLNAAYIYSKVDLGSQASAQKSIRQLQGQSPYIINTILAYNDKNAKLQIGLSYNVFGTRIYAVGDINNPDIYELPRHSLDLTISKAFNGFTVKAGVQDILNYKFRFYQDTDRNGKVNDAMDVPVFTYKRGTLFNMSFNIQL